MLIPWWNKALSFPFASLFPILLILLITIIMATINPIHRLWLCIRMISFVARPCLFTQQRACRCDGSTALKQKAMSPFSTRSNQWSRHSIDGFSCHFCYTLHSPTHLDGVQMESYTLRLSEENPDGFRLESSSEPFPCQILYTQTFQGKSGWILDGFHLPDSTLLYWQHS